MFDIEDILSIGSGAGFDQTALELFAFQAAQCEPYREYISALGVEPTTITRVENIPFLPIELFKSRRVYCGAGEPEVIFTSSSTGGDEPSRHYMRSAADYEKTFSTAFSHFYGAPEDWGFYALLPSYLEREGSSLVYMMDRLIAAGHGGFYLNDYQKLIDDIGRDAGPKLLMGVSYALLDLAEKFAPDLAGTVVMETGGMKGRREEIPKDEFHAILRTAFNVSDIHSEYGMAELTSQAYSQGGGRFRTPPWMKVQVRDLNDPFELLPNGKAGGINIIDMANLSSCAFIQTQDIGAIGRDGSFSILGRADRSEIRGCNLLIQ